MRPHRVVIEAPLLDEQSGFFETCEPLLVQTLFPKATIEAFDVPVLRGLTRVDEVQLHSIVLGPDVQFLASKLRSIVDLKQFGFTKPLSELLQHPHDALATQAGVNLNCQAAPGEDVDDIQRPRGASNENLSPN